MTVEQHVAEIATLDEDGKLSYLQRLIGSSTSNQYELAWRARLMSALNVAQVWPHRREAGDCWDVEDDGA